MTEPEKFKCHCGDWRFKNAFFVVDETREKVCRDLPFYGEIDGQKYCVLHFPRKEKASDFQTVFEERIQEDNWNFSMVYFPSQLTYENETFEKEADFSHATFAERVSFKNCQFENRFTFFDTIFIEEANFGHAHFHAQVNFNASDFRKTAHFYGSTFYSESFPSFSSAKFKKASFPGAKFLKTSFGRTLTFERARFEDQVDFSRAKFELDVLFNGADFPNEGKTNFSDVTFDGSLFFSGITFFDADFRRSKFCDLDIHFGKTVFLNCVFNKSASFAEASFKQSTNFGGSTFRHVHFEGATFTGNVSFLEATFAEDVFFSGAKFGLRADGLIRSANVGFEGSDFGERSRVFFDNTWFSYQVNFDYARFDGFLFFTGTDKNQVFDKVFEGDAFSSLLRFTNTTISKPENVYFRTVRLRPSWFVNNAFDVRRVNLFDIAWGTGSTISIPDELKIVGLRRTHNATKLLAITFRQLADNAEANSRFEEASDFRRLAFETEHLVRKGRVERWRDREFTHFEFLRNLADQIKSAPLDPALSLYRITSTYGEGSLRAFIWLSVFVIGAAILYASPFSDFSPDLGTQSLGLGESIAYSMRVMILQRPEPSPINSFAKIVLAIESLVAPLQLALLALALRRKFVR